MNMRSMRHVRRLVLGMVLALVVAACGSPSAPTLHTLSVTVGGTGDGTVTSSPAGIDTAVAGGSQADFEDGTTVTLTATAAAGSTFTGWGGACATAVGATCAVTVDAAQSVTASFDEVVHTLTVTVDGAGSGTVTSSPSGIDTSVFGGGQADFAEGTVVTLTATADAGSKVLGWGGACATTVGAVCDVTINADRNAFVTFDPLEGTLELTIAGLPPGVDADVRVTGPDGYDQTFTADASVVVPVGDYTVAPNPVEDAPAIYRSPSAVVTVMDDATTNANVVYEQPTVLYHEYLPSTYIPAALDANGFDVDDVSADNLTAVTNALNAGGYDLAVVLLPNDTSEAAFVTALENFVTGGGRVVYAEFSPTVDIATLFDASYSGSSNLTTADFDAPLDAGITDPVALDGTGYGTYANGLAPDVDGTSLCTFENGDSCFVLGNDGRTALLGFLGDTIPVADGQTFWENLSLFMLE